MAKAKSAISLGISALIVIAIIAIVGFGLFLNTTFNITSSTTNAVNTTSASTSTTHLGSCIVQGQPYDLLLRILSNSTLTPVVGAQVRATNQPALASCNGSALYPLTTETTVTFTTNGTEWYPLTGENNAGYSFAVSYSGQNYTLKANLRPASVTCATLLIPSGRTNLTITEFQTTCGGALAGVNRVTFIQQGACQPAYYLAPWSVTLGNQTIVEPSNATLPIPNNQFQASTANIIYAQIVFFVPSGIYNYSMSPNLMVGHSFGTISVNGSDVTVQVGPAPIFCTMTQSH